MHRVIAGMLLALATALAWYMWRPDSKVSEASIQPASPVASSIAATPPASAPKRAPSPFADAAPVIGPDRSMLEERALRNAPVVAAMPRDPVLAWQAWREAVRIFLDMRLNRAPQDLVVQAARIVDAGIDARVERKEISLDDGLALMTELVQVLESDPGKRELLLKQWREEKQGATPAQRP